MWYVHVCGLILVFRQIGYELNRTLAKLEKLTECKIHVHCACDCEYIEVDSYSMTACAYMYIVYYCN